MPPTTGPSSAGTARQMAARVRLDEALAALKVSAGEVRARQDVLAGLVKDRGDTEARLTRTARSPTASPELRELQDRVDRGELSWRAVLAGELDDDTRSTVEGLLDPTATHCRDARAAFDAHDERTDQAARAAEPATTPPT